MLEDTLPVHALLRDHAQNAYHGVPPEVKLLRLDQPERLPVLRCQTKGVEAEVSRVVLLLQVPDAGDGADSAPCILDGLALDERDQANRCNPEQGVHGRNLL